MPKLYDFIVKTIIQNHIMQNTVSNFINKKVINIKSEMLFREAEDEFYYFNNLKKAESKLKKAIELTPCHTKSITMYGNLCFIKGNFAKAVSLYLIANGLNPNDGKILASLANCYYSLKKYELSLKYADKALQNMEYDNFSLFSQIIEIKINCLSELKRYNEAYNTFIHSKNILKRTLLKETYRYLNEKIQLHKKLQFSGLKIV